MIQVAMIGKWHVHARDYTKMLLERADKAKITCVWDDDDARGKNWAEEIGVDFMSDYDALLARDDVDAIVVTTSTDEHHDVMIKAANAGKHIFTEKVLAATVTECNEIAKAIKANKVQFCISYPQMETPAFVYAKQVVDSGKLGEISRMRVRNGHDGSVAGWLPEHWYSRSRACGGVMMDLGCHPMYLSRYFLGEPKSIQSDFTYLTGREVEDCAVCTVKFKQGGVAIVESSFVAPCSPYIMEIYGTKGTIMIVGDRVELYEKTDDGTKITEITELPERPTTGIDQWLCAIETGKPVVYDLEMATQLTQLMEAAYVAEKEQRTVFFD